MGRWPTVGFIDVSFNSDGPGSRRRVPGESLAILEVVEASPEARQEAIDRRHRKASAQKPLAGV